MPEQDDLYALLGIQPTATTPEIARAYASQVAVSVTDPARMLLLANAFQVLGNPDRRAEYDRARVASALEAQPTEAAPGSAHPVIDPNRTAFVEPPQPGDAGPGIPVTAESPTVPGTIQVAAALDPHRTVLTEPDWSPGPPAASDVTQAPTTVTCPVCGTSNVVGLDPAAGFCQDCGFLLSQAPGVGQAPAQTGPGLVSADGAREYWLHEGVNAVGRQDAEVLLVDPTVSRLHARLYLAGDALEIEDANSTNGTKLNGVRLEPGKRHPVGNGECVQFGQVPLKARGVRPADKASQTPSEPATLNEPAPAAGTERATLTPVVGGAPLPIFAFPVSVGRRSDNDITISDPYVSGKHAEILETPEGFTVRDLGSTNGTIVDNEPLLKDTPVAVRDGSVIQFGKQRFCFALSAAAPAVATQTTADTEAPAAEMVQGSDEPGLVGQDKVAGENSPVEGAEPPSPDS